MPATPHYNISLRAPSHSFLSYSLPLSVSLPTPADPAASPASTPEWKLRFACFTVSPANERSAADKHVRTRTASDLSSASDRPSKRARLDVSTAGKAAPDAGMHQVSDAGKPLLGDEAKLASLVRALRDQQGAQEQSILEKAKTAYLQGEDAALGEGESKQQTSRTLDGAVLPERFAYIETVIHASESEGQATTGRESRHTRLERKLWLFNRRPPLPMGISEPQIPLEAPSAERDQGPATVRPVPESLEEEVFPPSPSALLLSPDSPTPTPLDDSGDRQEPNDPAGKLQLRSTGSFTYSDLFPSFFDATNGGYAPPSSRAGKVSLPPLLISGIAGNAEACKASEILLDAVRERLLALTRTHEEQPLLGGGLLLPPASIGSGGLHEPEPGSQRQILLYDLHFDTGGVVARSRVVPRQRGNLHLIRDDAVAKATDASPPSLDGTLGSGSKLLLSPVGLEATFVRFFGEPVTTKSASPSGQSQTSRRSLAEKQALQEQSALVSIRKSSIWPDLARCDRDERWVLCSTAGLDLVWPLSFCLRVQTVAEVKTSESATSSRLSSDPTEALYPPSASCLLPPAKKYEQLADRTCAYIEKITLERERERKERAERAMLQQPQQPQAAVPQKHSPPQGQGLSPSLFSTTSSATPGASAFSPEVQLSTAARADAVIPLAEAKVPQAIRKRRTVRTNISLAEMQGMLPPVPPAVLAERKKAAQNATISHLAATVGSGSSGSLQTAQTQSTVQAAADTAPAPPSAKLKDTFDDFLWSGFGTSGSQGAGADSNMSYGFSFGNAEMDTGMGGLGMFDMGVTDEDFSFFDEPVAPSIATATSAATTLPMSAPASQSLQDSKKRLQPDDLADFINSSGPVDHFSHLMPTGDSPASMLAHSTSSGTSPAFIAGDMPTPASLSMSQPAAAGTGRSLASPASASFGIAASPAPATGIPLALTQTIASTPFNTIEEIPEDTVFAKQDDLPHLYDVSTTCRRKGHGSRGLPLAYVPLTFESLTYAHQKILEKQAETAFDGDQLTRFKSSKAAQLKKQILAARGKVDRRQGLGQERRNWQQSASDSSPGSLTFDDTSSSSDEEENAQDGPSRSAQHAIAVPIFDEAAYGRDLVELVRASCSLAKLHSNTLSVARPTHTKTRDGLTSTEGKEVQTKTSRNKNEKEALATVFSLQYLENVDLRSRVRKPQASRGPQRPETHLPLLPGAPLSPMADLQETYITAFLHSAVMKLSVPSLQFWQKLGLQPHSALKDVKALMLLPSSLANEAVIAAAEYWLMRVGQAYQTAGLGTHTADVVDGSKGPCYVLQTGTASFGSLTDFGKDFTQTGAQIATACKTSANAVVYVLVTDSECRQPNISLLTLCLRLHLLGRGLIPHLIPISMLTSELHLLPRQEAKSPSWHRSELTRVAFAIYDRLAITVQRQESKRLEQLMRPAAEIAINTQIQQLRDTKTCPAPAWKIYPSRKPLVTFSTAWPPPTLDILDRHRLFHVAYSVSRDKRWLFLAGIDEKGEHSSVRARVVEGLEIKLLLRRVWNFAKEALEAVNVEWRLIVVRHGHLPVEEVKAWADLLSTTVPGFSKPLLVTVTNVVEPLATAPTPTTASPVPTATTDSQQGGDSLKLSAGAKLQSFTYADIGPQARAAFVNHPHPVLPSPTNARPEYYTAAAAHVCYVPKAAEESKVPIVDSPCPLAASSENTQPAGYTLQMLCSFAHPQSTFILPLSRHVQDVVQSFVDLQVLARERWSFSELDGPGVEILPWHLAAVQMLAQYDLGSLDL